MKKLLYLKDQELKQYIEKIFVGYRETVSDAKKILNKSFDPKLIKKMSDEDAINYLSELRQIGRWSSEMVLIFFYNRQNIWPVQDLSLIHI